ncbi:hypothetical protein ABE25_00655 [Cytobacillus firmus]|nr:CD1375 family protein [Cytobacillus firmus]MBG9548362.1 hypothetical protein [Cytobacillus firmus]MBG9600788.1 hypothetical protein [Cytobacillus firmus]MBG9657806.1 hypothetical protein [Cytobacillus firmus]
MKSLLIKAGFLFLRKGGVDVVPIYVALIIHGRRTFDSVPAILKDAVKTELLALGLDENGKPLEIA